MDTSQKQRLQKRLRYLWRGELVGGGGVSLMPFYLAHMLDESVNLFTLYAAVMVLFIVLQGAAYWIIKLRALKADKPIERHHIRPFVWFKYLNWVLLGLLPFILYLTSGQTRFNVILGTVLYALAFLEQINYYHYQLMYDYMPDVRQLFRTKRLRKASLHKQINKL